MADPNFPLRCSICPKKPEFSDVSHLLTHIASKGHLSHYFRIKVRSTTDRVSRDLIQAYDRWYSEWDVEKLMSERMHLKEKKRSQRHVHVTIPREVSKRRPANGLMLDPRLSAPLARSTPTLIKEEGPTPPLFQLPVHPGSSIRRKPRMHLWSTARPSSFDAVPLTYSNPPSETTGPGPGHELELALSLHERIASLQEEDDSQDHSWEASDHLKSVELKGVFWPGMDLFDSATLQMRRKRNQKKNASVVEQLEKNSLVVEPTELIFTPYGTFKKQRTISGQVDPDSSPLKEYLPLPPRRRPAARVALAEKDVNSKSLTGKPVLVQHFTKFGTTVRDAGNSDYEIDTKQQKRKRRMPVFNDQQLQEQPFGNPTGMICLTSGFHFSSRPNSSHDLPATEPQQTSQHQQSQCYQNFFAEAFDNYQPFHTAQPFYAVPFPGYGYQYGCYANPAQDIPGFFSNLPCQLSDQPEEGNTANKIDGETVDEKCYQDDNRTISATSDD